MNNRSNCDTSAKFGIDVHYSVQFHIRYRPIQDLPYNSYYGHFLFLAVFLYSDYILYNIAGVGSV